MARCALLVNERAQHAHTGRPRASAAQGTRPGRLQAGGDGEKDAHADALKRAPERSAVCSSTAELPGAAPGAASRAACQLPGPASANSGSPVRLAASSCVGASARKADSPLAHACVRRRRVTRRRCANTRGRLAKPAACARRSAASSSCHLPGPPGACPAPCLQRDMRGGGAHHHESEARRGQGPGQGGGAGAPWTAGRSSPAARARRSWSRRR